MPEQIPQIRQFVVAVGESLTSQTVSFFIGSMTIDNTGTLWLSLSIGPRTIYVPPLRIGFRVRALGAQSFTMISLPTDPITGTPITPGGSPVSLIASTEDAFDYEGTALAVTITGPVTATITGPVTVTGTITAILPAGTSYTANVQPVGNTATPIPAVALAARTGVLIRNVSATSTLWVGDATVAIGSGFPLEPGAAAVFPVDDATTVFGAHTVAAELASYIEIA